MIKQIFTSGAVLFSAINFSMAQITFQKILNGQADYGFCVQQTSDGGYIITGRSASDDVHLLKTDINGDTLWTKLFGGFDVEVGMDVRQTMDGGYIITGSTYTFGAGGSDIYVNKTDSNGNLTWSKTIGGIGAEESYAVEQTSDSGYIVCGYTRNFGAGNQDVYLFKLSAGGNLLWSKTYGGANNDIGLSVEQTTDGGYIVGGSYIIKTDANGDTLWTKTYTVVGTSYAGGGRVQQTSDGGYMVFGASVGFGAGGSDVCLIKTDTIGNVVWAKTYGGTGSDGASSGVQTSDGGYIFGGNTSSFGVSNNDLYVVKTDSIGNVIWSKTFGGSGYDYLYSLQQTNDGGYIVSGQVSNLAFLSGLYFIKTDVNGNTGCTQGSPATITGTPIMQVNSPAISVSTGGIENTAATVIYPWNSLINTLCTTVGSDELTTDNSFFISPNPSAGNFSIVFEKMIIKGKVEIVNIFGENVFSEDIFNESKKKINLKTISQGIYFIKVFDQEKYYCRKIIIEQ